MQDGRLGDRRFLSGMTRVP
ncbi:hypothetical protein CEXT_647001, partial [Caerostris extrusa]